MCSDFFSVSSKIVQYNKYVDLHKLSEVTVEIKTEVEKNQFEQLIEEKIQVSFFQFLCSNLINKYIYIYIYIYIYVFASFSNYRATCSVLKEQMDDG